MTPLNCFLANDKTSLPLFALTPELYNSWLEKQSAFTQNWLQAQKFTAKSGQTALIPNENGQTIFAVVGLDDMQSWKAFGAYPYQLAPYTYHIANPNDWPNLTDLFLAWGMGAYQFTRYKKSNTSPAQLCWPENFAPEIVLNKLKAIYLVRDLINTPANDMMPEHLSEAAQSLAKTYQATFKEWVGEELLADNFPSIYTVGCASAHAPRLLELRWGNPAHPKIAIVGKGVCFDTGGLDLKPASAMALMKKDMGGAAHALGLAQLIMTEKLPLCLHVLMPCVENAVAGNAYRPGDILNTRKGLTVEIGNTDAEGRVILADALTLACENQPELMIDFATLTGAAKVATGTELPAFFCNNDQLASQLFEQATTVQDPCWRLPLYKPYRQLLDSKIADINNAGKDAYAGAILAALYLQEFVDTDIPWCHFDIMAYNLSKRPSHPEGAEAMGLLATYQLLKTKYCHD